MPCPRCTYEVRWNETTCARCGTSLGYPNVRLASELRAGLLARHRAVISSVPASRSSGVAALNDVAEQTVAAVAMPASVAFGLLTSNTSLYAAYGPMVHARMRRPGMPDDDTLRTAVEGKLYGALGVGSIRYAALSADGSGLESYGSVCCVLHDGAIAHRSTVLEGNSWHVLGPRPIGEPLPEGCLAGWEDRAKLVVAVTGADLRASPSSKQLHRAILRPTDDRATDRFFEVHIWDSFNVDSVAQFIATAPKSEDDALMQELAREKALHEKRIWRAS